LTSGTLLTWAGLWWLSLLVRFAPIARRTISATHCSAMLHFFARAQPERMGITAIGSRDG
jgi:hypothetical protein